MCLCGMVGLHVIEYLLLVPWVWGFPWGFQWGFLWYGMGMGIEMSSPRQPWEIDMLEKFAWTSRSLVRGLRSVEPWNSLSGRDK